MKIVIPKDEGRAFQDSESTQLVLTYKSLARQAAKLLLTNGNAAANMSADDFSYYRRLSDRRDIAWHMIQVMQTQLLDDNAMAAG